MRYLVTGGAGCIGTNVIKRILSDGNEVISLDNYSTGLRENEQEGCRYIDGDIHQMKYWGKRLEEQDLVPDVIIHLAALARIQPSIKNPELTIENNFNGTLQVLHYAKEHNIQIIYAGSSSKHHGLYGSPYAWSKFGGEELCKLYSEVYGLNTTICRFYNVYGPHQIEDGDYNTVIGYFEKLYRENKPLTITGDGEQRRDFTHVDDIVDGIIRCVGKKFKAEIFELGRGVNFSINELAEMFDTETTYIPARKGEYPYTLCDFSKAEELLGWTPTKDLKDYINGIK